VDPIADTRKIVRIDSSIDVAGLTLWSEDDAKNNGFLDPVPFISRIIEKRKVFWNQVVAEYSAQNVLLGITTEQVVHVSTRLKDIMTLGLSGSLETVISELQAMTPDAMTETYHWLTQAQIDGVVAKIQAYLAEE
ncbi:MAG: hypothetical protein R3213_13505, partial [Flavobacteriaceae bacterium]|nr:hypothetical protein [Flavobacteriaceae bacterium]